jgi:2-oxoglutarate dehydrogenase E1 component
MAAEYNMIVLNMTTAANLFHMMRRQLTWDFRKPAIVFSPKSLLRHPSVASPLKEFTSGSFKEVIDDENTNAKDVKRIVLCTGKIFYELKDLQQKKKIKDIAIVRLEQLYPFPEKQLHAILKKYEGKAGKTELCWVQEEPLNMGYWSFVQRMMPDQKFKLVSRKASASPATGYSKVHKTEQEKLINQAFE